MKKGIIALDIDGTITTESHSMEKEVSHYLDQLVHDGWTLIFITGRTFAWGHAVLQALTVPYYFAVHNGAIILEMPSRKVISKKYLDTTVLPEMRAITSAEATGFIVYGGYEYQDLCYYCPDNFSASLREYFSRRIRFSQESWIPLQSFDELPISDFAAVKCISDYNIISKIAQQIEKRLSLHVPIIRDPFQEGYFVAQATHPDVSKGNAVVDLKNILGYHGPVIAAGDDNNDRTMLAEADIKVVMATAPSDMIAKATIVAPPASEKGIITGLTEAISIRSKKI